MPPTFSPILVLRPSSPPFLLALLFLLLFLFLEFDDPSFVSTRPTDSVSPGARRDAVCDHSPVLIFPFESSPGYRPRPTRSLPPPLYSGLKDSTILSSPTPSSLFLRVHSFFLRIYLPIREKRPSRRRGESRSRSKMSSREGERSVETEGNSSPLCFDIFFFFSTPHTNTTRSFSSRLNLAGLLNLIVFLRGSR